jgi:hypothetical protein
VNIFDMIGVRSVELLDFMSGCWVNLAAIGQTTNGLRREDGIRDPVLTENPNEQGGDGSCNYPTYARSAGVPIYPFLHGRLATLLNAMDCGGRHSVTAAHEREASLDEASSSAEVPAGTHAKP